MRKGQRYLYQMMKVTLGSVQVINVSTLQNIYILFVAVFFGYNQYWLGAPEGSTGSGFCFKASQKTGPKLKSHIR